MNTLKHGMAAQDVVVPGENPAELRASHRSFLAAWQPVGAIEAKLVWEITILDWRLRRARRLEPRLVEMGSARSQHRGEVDSRVLEALDGDDSAFGGPSRGSFACHRDLCQKY